MDEGELLDEQLQYYDRRAEIYDQTYTRTGHSDRGAEANARWWAELREVESALDAAQLAGDVLELGCGTGYWTYRLAQKARSITALDGSPQMIALARERLHPAGNVSFERLDVMREWVPSREYDGIAAFFFLEHVPDPYFDDVVEKMASSLRPGGKVFLAEGLWREPGPQVEHRDLHGNEFRVVERRRREVEFVETFRAHGVEVEYEATERLFCIVDGAKTGNH